MSRYEIKCIACGVVNLDNCQNILSDKLISLVIGEMPNKTNCPICDYPHQIIRFKKTQINGLKDSKEE